MCRGTVLGVGAGRSCPIIGVGLGNLTGWVAEDKLEGGLGACLQRGGVALAMRDKPPWVMEIEGIVLLLRDGGVGKEVL